MDKLFIIIPLILCIAAYFEYNNLKQLHKEYYELPKDYHSIFIVVLICAALTFAIYFFLPDVNGRYQARIEASYDDANYVKWYLRGDEDTTKEEAIQSMHNLYDKLYPGEW